MHREPVVLGRYAPEMALDEPRGAIVGVHSSMSETGGRRHQQYFAEGANASQRWVIRQPR